MPITEAAQYYQAALRQGQKEYKSCVHRGRYPYIQSLQSIRRKPLSQVSLGTMEIPLYLVVGSTQDNRCNSFSPGFYPLLEPGTEFAQKWVSLCAAQLTEGIHDPIKCYEYLGRFYAEEGNKRVSVLKSMGAVSVRAEVTRLMPEASDDATVKIYQEFLEFYRCSKCWGVHFSDPGGYAALQAAFGFAKDREWPEDLRRSFKNHYFTFRDCFYRLGGGGLGLTTGDALLLWLRFHSGAEFLNMEAADYRRTLTAVWRELCVYTEEQPIAVSLAPSEEGKKAGLPSLSKKKLRCAFLFQKNREDSAWTAAHDRGRAHLEETLGDSVKTLCYYDVEPEQADAVLEQAVEDGAELVFTTSVSFLDAALRVAVKYPKVRFMNCSIDQPYVNVKAYYFRLYEAKFITGAIAGALSKTGRIGYVGSYPILGVPASINAFALGAALTNPEARVDLRWHCLPGDYMSEFRAQGITLVSDRDYFAEQPWGSQGLARFQEDGSLKLLASPSWLWGEFYVRIVRELLRDPRRVPLAEDSDRAINYWWGMSSGAVDLKLSGELPEGTRALARILQNGIQAGTVQPFRRLIRAQDGRVVNDGGRDLSMEEILKMDWLCDRVDGRLPAYDELLPIARPTVRRLGIDRRLIPPEEAGR